MRYIPLKSTDRDAMLATIGVASVDDLFASIPSEVRRKGAPDLPSGMTEVELRSWFNTLSRKNEAVSPNGWLPFLGAGAYEHFIPSVVDAIASRGEFSTAYTPYQPEISQGTLQAIFEFQSMVANLFGLEVSNASMYDGASALAEAILMAMRVREGGRVVLSTGIHPDYRATVKAYLSDSDIEIIDAGLDREGRTVLPELFRGTVAVVLQQPNFFGVIEPIDQMSAKAHEAEALSVVTTTEPMAFGALKSPGEQGADIVAGEGQSFGNPLSFGGPYVGLFASKREYVRQMPGRLVGKTKDQEGRDGYVLTLATREQHIKRERATSNICTNHSLCALRSAVYLATVGERGLREISLRNSTLAHQLRSELLKVKGVEPLYTGPIFNEFAVRIRGSVAKFLEAFEAEKMLAGVPLARWKGMPADALLIAVTETKEEADLKRYAEIARRLA